MDPVIEAIENCPDGQYIHSITYDDDGGVSFDVRTIKDMPDGHPWPRWVKYAENSVSSGYENIPAVRRRAQKGLEDRQGNDEQGDGNMQ